MIFLLFHWIAYIGGEVPLISPIIHSILAFISLFIITPYLISKDEL